MPRVSVIVAARDAAATLPETLASVADQTFADWELVLVDDASSDATAEQVAILGDRARVLRNETALGPAAARNRGVERANGELVATLDADDLWQPAYLERQVSLYDSARASGRRVAVVCCDAKLIGAENRDGQRWSDLVRLPATATLDGLLRENFVYNSVVMSRAVFLELEGYKVELVGVEDFDLWLRVAEAGWEICVNPEPLAIYRLRADSLSADAVRLANGTCLVYEEALARGRLTRRQRALARRRWRLHRLLARRAELAQRHINGRTSGLDAIALAPATARAILEHPERWWGWARHGPRPPGPGRHAGDPH